jgi:Domain of unknown function (DUF4345)
MSSGDKRRCRAHSRLSRDSELRFYAVLWGAYGVPLVMAAANIAAHLDLIPWLAAAFFAGGIGRAFFGLRPAGSQPPPPRANSG